VSDVIRIALVGEGVTDFEILQAAIQAMLGERRFILTLLQPEGSIAFMGGGNAGPFGGGWNGVFKWCRQAVLRAGRLSDDPLFAVYDLLILHLDADVAAEQATNEMVNEGMGTLLPCERVCPPPRATTDELRAVMLTWIGETQTPGRTVLCTPSKSTEAWVMAAFFPNDREMARWGWECHPDPEGRLALQPKSLRFKKTRVAYQERAQSFQDSWFTVCGMLSEATRFRDDFLSVVP